MKIRLFTYVILLLILLQSCIDDSYRGLADDPQVNPEDRVPVVVLVGDPEEIEAEQKSSTKGTGPMSEFKDWKDKQIYVYAFNKYFTSSFTSLSSSGDIHCLVDGSVDEPGTLAGKKARVLASGMAEWEGQQKNVWYPVGEHETQHYDFFAYYIDDLNVPKSAYHRAYDQIYLDVEIDGRRDLMSAKAKVTEHQLAKFDDEEKERIMDYSYSYYTGARSVLPEFYFNHHLSKIDFEIVPGYVENDVKYIYVEEISIESKYKASFIVADRKEPTMQGLYFKNEIKNLYLAEEDGSELRQGHYFVETLRSLDQTGTPIHVGGSLLVAPGDPRMKASITVKEIRLDGTVVEESKMNELILDLGEEVYEPGTRYVVKLTLFGSMNIATTIETTAWDEGGDIIVDTEDKFE